MQAGLSLIDKYCIFSHAASKCLPFFQSLTFKSGVAQQKKASYKRSTLIQVSSKRFPYLTFSVRSNEEYNKNIISMWDK